MNLLTSMSTTANDAGSAVGGVIGAVFGIAAYVIWVIALWRTFTKAGYAGWLAIIPIVNLFVLVKIAGFTAWLGLLYFVPIANIVLHIIVALRVGRGFGKGAAFSIFLLWLLSLIGYLIIAFDDSTYTKPDHI